jgi:hypothetical protein
MARFVLGGSILSKNSIVLFCALALASFHVPVALAQHAGGHFGGAGVGATGAHVFAPPISHPAISRPPLPGRFPATVYRNGGLLYRPNPFRPFPRYYPVYGSLFFGAQSWWFWTNAGYNSCWWTSCYLSWGYPYSALPFYQYPSGNVSVYQYPLYVYGGQSRDYPELYLKDGTVLTVTDYWLVDDQLHFRMMEDGNRSVEHVIALDELDLQTTIDVNTRRGFRFVLRNEPMDQYLQHHPNEPPPNWTLPPKN